METLQFYPEDVVFNEVRTNQTYIQSVTITNVTHNTVSFRIRPGSVDRLSVEPATVTLARGESKKVQVQLKLTKPLAKKKGSAPYKDTVHVKSDFFEKKFQVLGAALLRKPRSCFAAQDSEPCAPRCPSLRVDRRAKRTLSVHS
jgi:hypothetical protein